MLVSDKCNVCGIVQDIEEFRPHRHTCRLCTNKYKVKHNKAIHERVIELRKQYKPKFEIIHRKYNLQSKYGITPEDYKRMLVEQDNKCAICNRSQEEFKKKFSVDHNHETGAVRGLLCIPCNIKLAALDNKEFLRKATIYLQKENSN
jgi:hypothetical protein